MPTISSYADDLRSLIPFIKDRTYDRCGADPSVVRSYSYEIKLCSSSNCVTVYRDYWGSVYVVDGRSGHKAYIGNYSLDEGLDYIAALLCT